MSRENEIINKLDELIGKIDLITSFLPQEVQQEIRRQELLAEFERVKILALRDPKPLQAFLRLHPEMLKLKSNSSMS